MEQPTPYIIKSFKHDGHLHRMWLHNWLVPKERMFQEHAEESMYILVNSQTRIREGDGKEWVSRIPSVAFFIPGQWYNIVSLIEEQGIRYYCNIASPPYVSGKVLTYIDYDLDVIRTIDGGVLVVDQEEYEQHKADYHYPDIVDRKVKSGMDGLLQRIKGSHSPFEDERVMAYYQMWKHVVPEV
ncbi:MAG: hypothetical protein K0R67_3318 [Paenibacillus sp.]|nr:hypothetical protein [Paenibacillus sp.]